MTFESIYEPLREHTGHKLEIQTVDEEEDSVILFCDDCGLILADIMDGVRLRGKRKPSEVDCIACGRPEISYCPNCEGEMGWAERLPMLQ
jgi:hypothetical protein